MAEQSDTSGSNNDGNNAGATSTGGDSFKPITTPEELSAFLGDRVARAEKKATEKFADYDELKSKAAQLDQLQEATKTEAQKAAERLAKLEERAAAAELSALRSKIQARHSISDDDADLFLTGTDEATLTKQAKRLAERDAERKKHGNRVSREGTNSSTGAASDEREFVSDLFGSGA